MSTISIHDCLRVMVFQTSVFKFQVCIQKGYYVTFSCVYSCTRAILKTLEHPRQHGGRVMWTHSAGTNSTSGRV
jgi:hypothetical protein